MQVNRRNAIYSALLTTVLLGTGCATRSDYETYFLAERDNFDGALAAAREAQGGVIEELILGTGASPCRDYESVVTVLVAKGDFNGARSACRGYGAECALQPDTQLCFTYSTVELAEASGNAKLAASLSAYAQQALHFRWLTIRDDYEDRPPRRPIF